MKIHVSSIQNKYLRRAVMLALPVVLYPIMVVLGAIKGPLDLTASLVGSWGPAWRGEPAEMPHAQVGVDRGMLTILIPIDLIAFAAQHGPFQHHLDPESVRPEDVLRVTDPLAFAKAVGHEICAEQDEVTGTLLHEMVDDAIERVIDIQGPGFVWPAAGIETRGNPASPDLNDGGG